MTILQSARGDSLQEEGGVVDFADRDAMEAREEVWCMSGGIYRHHVTSREHRHSHPSQFRQKTLTS